MVVRLRGNLHELLEVWLVVRWKCYATQPTRRGPATTHGGRGQRGVEVEVRSGTQWRLGSSSSPRRSSLLSDWYRVSRDARTALRGSRTARVTPLTVKNARARV